MKIYQLKNGNIEVITKIHKDGSNEGFIIVMDEHPEAKIQVAIGYCRTSKPKECKCHDEYVAWEVEHL